MTTAQTASTDVIVVGGGLAGLTAATYAARAGRSVTLFEKARGLGGRACTHDEGGFLFNIGPHALYNGSAARPILKELGVLYSGKPPQTSGGFAVRGGRKHTLPGGMLSLLTTGLLGLPAKLELAGLLGGLGRIDPEPWRRQSVRAWLDSTVRHAEVRALLEALVRVSTYANIPEQLSAGAAIRQLQLAFGKGVLYLDGGWQTLVDGLRQAASRAGVRFQSGVRVEAVEGAECVRGVRLANGERLRSTAVILTGGPEDAATLVQDGSSPTLRRWATDAVPVRAACLDVGLARLPRPKATFGLGIDEPLYFSVHSAYAKLGPEATATIHVAKYLAPRDDAGGEARAIEAELEGLLDLLQPGWREAVAARRFLPKMTVAHHIPTAADGGYEGRPSVAVPEIADLYVAGDWVGDQGMLADASLASAKRAAELAVRAKGLSAAA